MRKGILDVTLYEGHEKELMVGALSSLAGSGIWLILATALRLPISGTHSIVGATVGFSLVCRGTAGVSKIIATRARVISRCNESIFAGEMGSSCEHSGVLVRESCT